jgi:DNA polymerase elongation subunit (family B)
LKTLAIDIETTPNLAHVWQLWNINNVSLSQLQESSELLCFSAKWLGDDEVKFYSKWDDGQRSMVVAAHSLLDDADAVLHYNGKRFDIPYLNGEFVKMDLKPPAPYAQIDLYQTVKRRFKFPSNKLDYVAQVLGFEGKVQHMGHELWVQVMAGEAEAQDLMREYNIRDTIMLEEIYEKLLPWIPNHPNISLYDDNSPGGCDKCGSTRLQRRDASYTALSKFDRYQCLKCGGWMRKVTRAGGSDLRSAVW